MGSLPRLRDGSLFYVVLGAVVTSFYFIVIGKLSTTRVVNLVDHNGGAANFSRRNSEYEEVCREWLDLMDQEELLNRNSSIIDESTEDVKETKNWDNSFEMSSHLRCDIKYKDKEVIQRGHYYAIYNYVRAEKEFGCTETITLTAPADFRFLDNVVPLVEKWMGPISIALYAPGHDFYTTLRAISYLRNCGTDLIRKYVTFHIFFDQAHTPAARNGSSILTLYTDLYNDCTALPPWAETNDTDMYKFQNNLLYPINVARNIAKLGAQTYFVFPSDIELYPTKNFIPLFMKFWKENPELFTPESRNVFVLPIFEILANETVPENKTQLMAMLATKTAQLFHEGVCTRCHKVIESDKWVAAPETEGLGVFSVGKRIGPHIVWEPFYVCTQKEPLWDERMTWEGQNNKMVQAFTMCVLNYDFHVLDNAFLIHKPGVKKKKVQMVRYGQVVKESSALLQKIAIELQELYGYNKKCGTKYIFQRPKPKPKVPVILPKT
ncbi:unnamed protein product [Ceutorhynchus assimilis]|uniref:Uncharacterized protein n=1 Tax=Ceutorhynchus assimilis TaxID=467358 RepID=A0A9P0DIM6_9CUCU|nr:unnamed protein product [Ceutorhynchus assimilis]